MIRGIVMAALAVGVAVGNPALAASSCKDALGKVIKCPTKAKAETARTCKVKGKAVPCAKNQAQETDYNGRVNYKF